jgi:hypothetical protein
MHLSRIITHLSELKAASCLVGMHPDEATELIVDCGLAWGIPFAVVPCCVFATLFSERRLHGGGSVSTYEDLIAYLMEKDTRIRREFLNFHGRNQVLYFIPEM